MAVDLDRIEKRLKAEQQRRDENLEALRKDSDFVGVPTQVFDKVREVQHSTLPQYIAGMQNAYFAKDSSGNYIISGGVKQEATPEQLAAATKAITAARDAKVLAEVVDSFPTFSKLEPAQKQAAATRILERVNTELPVVDMSPIKNTFDTAVSKVYDDSKGGWQWGGIVGALSGILIALFGFGAADAGIFGLLGIVTLGAAGLFAGDWVGDRMAYSDAAASAKNALDSGVAKARELAAGTVSEPTVILKRSADGKITGTITDNGKALEVEGLVQDGKVLIKDGFAVGKAHETANDRIATDVFLEVNPDTITAQGTPVVGAGKTIAGKNPQMFNY